MSIHFRYRAELQALVSDEPILRALGLTGEWRRSYVRFLGDEQPFAVLTFERAARMLRVDVYDGPRSDATEISADGMGSALATLHRSGVRPAQQRQAPDHARQLIRRVPELRERVLDPLADPPEPGPARPLRSGWSTATRSG